MCRPGRRRGWCVLSCGCVRECSTPPYQQWGERPGSGRLRWLAIPTARCLAFAAPFPRFLGSSKPRRHPRHRCAPMPATATRGRTAAMRCHRAVLGGEEVPRKRKSARLPRLVIALHPERSSAARTHKKRPRPSAGPPTSAYSTSRSGLTTTGIGTPASRRDPDDYEVEPPSPQKKERTSETRPRGRGTLRASFRPSFARSVC